MRNACLLIAGAFLLITCSFVPVAHAGPPRVGDPCDPCKNDQERVAQIQAQIRGVQASQERLLNGRPAASAAQKAAQLPQLAAQLERLNREAEAAQLALSQCQRHPLCPGTPHLGCYDGACACEPGYVACGGECFNLAADPAHCGACDIKCRGNACTAGVCGGAQPPPAQSSAGAAFDMTPGLCSEYESHPTLSLSSGLLFQASGNGNNGQAVSWAAPQDPTKWTVAGTMTAAPAMAESGGDPPYLPQGDVWTTSSGYSGRDYVAARTVDTPPAGKKGHSAPGLVALDAAALQGGKLGQAQWVIPPSSADDGLTVAADPGGASLWLAATGGTIVHNHPALVLFPRCRGAVDDPATCPRDKSFAGTGMADLMAGATGRGRGSHTTVIVNPCTHHALVSFLENDSAQQRSYVEVRAVDHGGRVVGSWELPIPLQTTDQQCRDAGAQNPFNCAAGNIATLCPGPTATNSNCCWHANTCTPQNGTRSAISRIYARVQMDVKVTGEGPGAACTLYLGWDDAAGAPGPVRRQSTLGSLDVTGEGAGAAIRVLSRADASLGESIDTVPVASRFAKVFGFFYVQRDPSGATEVLHARVSDDPTFASYTDLPVFSPPAANTWMGDSMSHLLGGLPGGQLLATWPASYLKGKKGCGTIDGAIITVAPARGKKSQASPRRLVRTPPVPQPDFYDALPPDGDEE